MPHSRNAKDDADLIKNKLIKIIHFGKYYPPDSGGIEAVTAGLAEGTASAGHEVSVVCFNKNNKQLKDISNGVRIIRNRAKLVIASQPLGVRYLYWCLAASRDVDIVHVHVPNALAAISALFVKRKVRILVHWHSDVIEKGFLGVLSRPLETLLLRRAKAIIATSEAYMRSSRSLSPFLGKTIVIPIGIPDVTRRARCAVTPPLITDFLKGRRFVLAVGRLVPYKGFSILIKAVHRLPSDVAVVIVGDGPLRHQLQDEINAAGLCHAVLLAGYIPDDGLQTLFSTATLFCLPSVSRAEAFGVVLLEAMSHGLPVVSTDIKGSGVSWVNRHGISGLCVPPEDPVALGEACSKVLTSLSLREELSKGARHRYLTKFTRASEIAKTIDVYKRLL
jgi:glycosyltransferase involved in cell wall biosynthesis